MPRISNRSDNPSRRRRILHVSASILSCGENVRGRKEARDGPIDHPAIDGSLDCTGKAQLLQPIQ